MNDKKKAYLAVIGFVVFCIPISVYAVLHQVNAWPSASDAVLTTTVNTPENHTPLLTTTTLPVGHPHQLYSFTIQGIDQDLKDTLKISTFGLPPGFKLTNCLSDSSSTDANSFSCLITGTPINKGVYRVYITIRDDHHASTQTRYQLIVK